jgi:hypothetical protein
MSRTAVAKAPLRYDTSFPIPPESPKGGAPSLFRATRVR